MYIKTKKNIGEQEKEKIIEFLKSNGLGIIITEDEDILKIGVMGNKKM